MMFADAFRTMHATDKIVLILSVSTLHNTGLLCLLWFKGLMTLFIKESRIPTGNGHF